MALVRSKFEGRTVAKSAPSHRFTSLAVGYFLWRRA